MKLKIWMLLLLGCMMCACSDDEPQRIFPGGDRHDTEQDDDKKSDEDSNSLDESILIWRGLDSDEWSPWKGYCCKERDPWIWEELEVWFCDKEYYDSGLDITYNAQVNWNKYKGQGFDYSRDDCKQWMCHYSIEGDTVTITGPQIEKINWKDCVMEDSIVLKLVYREGQLCPVNPEYKGFRLGTKQIKTYADGQIIENRKEELSKIWIHENGKNILDLQNNQFVQLESRGSQKIEYYKWWGDWHYEYVQQYILFGDEFASDRGEWVIVEFSGDKLVLKSCRKGTVDTYYLGSEADLPSTQEVMLRLTNPKSWYNRLEYVEDNHYDTGLRFYEDGTFYFGRSREYATSGTFKIVGDKIEMNFEQVNIDFDGDSESPKPAGYHIDGFYDGQPRKELCPFVINSFTSLTIEIPGCEKKTYTAEFTGKWKVGR